jgi:glycerol-3-phosphate cytidylyltransferase-like family protein
MNKVVLVTSGFDPIYSGHIAYFKSAKTLGDVPLRVVEVQYGEQCVEEDIERQ